MNIEYPEIKALMRIGKRDIDVFEVTVPKDAQVAGMTVEAIAQIRAIANELGRDGITSVYVTPTLLDTPGTRAALLRAWVPQSRNTLGASRAATRTDSSKGSGSSDSSLEGPELPVARCADTAIFETMGCQR